MGYKFNNKTGFWEAFYAKRHPVTRVPVSARRTKCKTEAEAKRAEKALIIQVEQKLHEAVVPKWPSLVQDCCRVNLEKGMMEKTVENYRVCLEAHTFEAWGDRFIDSINSEEIRNLIKARVGHRSPSHQKNLLKFIRGVFNHAVDSGSLNRNPCPQMKFRTGDKIKKVLTEEQVRLFLSKAKELDSEWYPHWAMAVYTGMRNGELYALTWDKVNLDDRLILVDSSWNKIDGFKSTKSGNDRMVEIAPSMIPMLKELKLKSFDSHFVLPRINHWDEGHQAEVLRMFLTGIGLPQIRFHDLRATWATLMLGKGVEPAKVMVMGGWNDIKTLMVYMRKAGINIRGITDCLKLHNPSQEAGKVLEFDLRNRQ